MRRPFGIGKTRNDYSEQISPELFDACPKAVFAAIAVSPAINGGGNFDVEYTPDQWIATEWDCLHKNGIVPQPLPARFRWLITESSLPS